MAKCPCGSAVPFQRCCEPLLTGKRPAATPAELVRARYTAFTRQDFDFLLRSHHPATVVRFDVDGNRRWAEQASWQGLQVIDERPGAEPDRATVEFRATYSERGVRREHREVSVFARVDGRWLYVDGAPPRDRDPSVNP